MKDRRIQTARHLRRTQTDAEYRLWDALRSRQLLKYKFRRQHKIGPYIADFACVACRLIVEADGSQHAISTTDAQRTAALESWGWRVMRFWNNDILDNRDGVQETILQALEERKNRENYVPPILELIRE